MDEVNESGKVIGKIVELPVDDILPNRYQPRIKFDDSAIFELSESIKIHGVFQPIIVRPIGDKYEIIAGERRYKASVLANKKTIPAIIMDLNDKDTIEVALIENVQRANLTPIEEAITYKKILDMGYINQDDLAKKLGKTQSTVANKLRLLNLDEDVQEALLENKISERHARSLLRLKDYNDQKLLLKKIVNERLTVRKTDEEIDKMLNGNDNTTQPSTVAKPVIIDMQNNAIPEIVETPNNIEQNDIVEEPISTSSVFGFGGNNEIINAAPAKETANDSTVMDIKDNEVKIPFVAPTVMNVDNIQTVAQDVNPEKPLAPMDEFLKSTEVEPKEEIPEPTSQGKFFSFFDDNKEDTESEVEKAEESKNFSFDNLYSTVTPVDNKSGFETQAEKPLETPINQVPVVENEQIPNSTPSFDQFFNTTPTTEEVDDVVIPTVNVTPFGFEDTTKASAVAEPTITVPNIPVMPQYESVQTVAPEINAPKNIMSAVNIIRDAISKLENIGYKVDCDEIDLETMYQMIVKIEKD